MNQEEPGTELAQLPQSYGLPIVPIAGFNLSPSASFEEKLAYLDMISEYTQEATIHFDDLDRKFEGKNPVATVEIDGIVIKAAGRLDDQGRYFDPLTGQERHAFIVLCKLADGQILLFQSFGATNWAAGMLQIVGHPGDFGQTLKFKIKQVPTRQGHTYTFRHIRQ